MVILIYKRTHIGDPNLDGKFGINDCMGQIRNFKFDAVIGIGGKSSEPKSYGISYKINWIGIKPTTKEYHNKRAPVISFEHFLLLENKGPKLKNIAPILAERFFTKKSRFVLNKFSIDEKNEVESILRWSKGKHSITKTEYNKLNNINKKKLSSCNCT